MTTLGDHSSDPVTRSAVQEGAAVVPLEFGSPVQGAAVVPEPPLPKVRDRIVILGRRRAGKTIYLARLYERLWKSPGHLHMRALSGETHKACMQVIEDLKACRWPAGTLGAQYSDIEISYNGSKHLLVALDYPGEVFRKAFVDNAETEDAKELLDHVDRAAAVILLLDPVIMKDAALNETIDDEYGMVQAIHRIREWPGGQEVPIVMVFTKCDMHKHMLRDTGGLRAYAVQHYSNLIRALNKFKVYACAAVRGKRDASGKIVPVMGADPIGVVEPLEYCLHKITERQRTEQEAKETQERVEAYERFLRQEYDAKRKTVMFWAIFWAVALALMGGTAMVTWILTHAQSKGS